MNTLTIPGLVLAVSAGALGAVAGINADGSPGRAASGEAGTVAVTRSTERGSRPLFALPVGSDSDRLHTIDCTGTKACEGEKLDCPAGEDCQIICNGLDACDDGVFNCPAGFSCKLLCEGKDACGDSNLNCNGAGPCTIECGTHEAACEGATVNCSAGRCEAICNGSQPPTMKACDEASGCIRCQAGEPVCAV